MRLTQSQMADLVLAQATQLREEVRADLKDKRFGGTDVQMKTYNDLAARAIALFPEDPMLDRLESMPDETLRAFGPIFPVGQLPVQMPSERLDSHLGRLINRLQQLVGEPGGTATPTRSAPDVLRDEQDAVARSILDALEALRREQPELPPVDARSFDFIADPDMRRVLAEDFLEAQRAFGVGAFKASALLSAGVIEGMLLDTLQKPSVQALPGYPSAAAVLPVVSGATNWDKVSLAQLIKVARDLGLIDRAAGRMAEGARDFRDTVHPEAEIRQGIRAGREEAELLLALVKLLYRRLAAVQ